jgi:hypothetical protein
MAERPLRLLLGEAVDVGVDDEDEDLLSGELPEEAVAAWLCAGCGAVSEKDVFTCVCQGASTPIRVWIARASGGQKTRRCLACARRTGGDPVSRFLTGSDAPVSVIATAHARGRGAACAQKVAISACFCARDARAPGVCAKKCVAVRSRQTVTATAVESVF